MLDDAAEGLLLQVAVQPLRDVLIVMRDMGLRPDEVFRMRWEHVHWEKRLYFNPHGKSRKARRRIPLSQRAIEALKKQAAQTDHYDQRDAENYQRRREPPNGFSLRRGPKPGT